MIHPPYISPIRRCFLPFLFKKNSTKQERFKTWKIRHLPGRERFGIVLGCYVGKTMSCSSPMTGNGFYIPPIYGDDWGGFMALFYPHETLKTQRKPMWTDLSAHVTCWKCWGCGNCRKSSFQRRMSAKQIMRSGNCLVVSLKSLNMVILFGDMLCDI